MATVRPRLAALARTFPSLDNAPLEPWDPEKFDRWARVLSSGGQHAARFILAVWNGNNNNPARRVRRWLLEDFEGQIERCGRKAGDDTRADRYVDAARSAYIDGERAKSLEQAHKAAAKLQAWAPLVTWLAGPRLVAEEEVLHKLAQAAVWDVGPFDVMDALGTWDDAHRAAFAAWVARPWWE